MTGYPLQSHGEAPNDGHIETFLVKTPFAIQVVTSCFAFVFYLSLLLVSLVSVYCKVTIKSISSARLAVVLFLGLLMVAIATLVNYQAHSEEVRQGFRMFGGCVIGLLYLLWGTWMLFEKPYHQTGVRTCLRGVPMLGNFLPSMGMVVGWITFPIVVIELMMLIGSRPIALHHQPSTNTTSDPDTRSEPELIEVDPLTAHALHMALRGVFLAQKILQSITYSWLRGTVAVTPLKEQAVFFFRVLGFFNFILWLDCITFIEVDAEMDNLSITYGAAGGVIEVVYDALIIDYRLLCCLLFLEHSFHMEVKGSQTGYTVMQQEQQDRFVSVKHISLEEKRLKHYGTYLGLMCVLLEIVVCLHYKKELEIGPWVHVLSIIVCVVVASCGSVMLWKNKLVDVHSHGDSEDHIVDLMVCCMGCAGAICWLVKGSIAAYWSTCYHGDLANSMRWAAVKLFARCLLVMFLMALFNKIKIDDIVIRNRNLRWNNFFVPTLILGMLAVFLGSAIDQHTGAVDEAFERNAPFLDQSVQFLFHIGPPFHLGFCIHIFLHFFIIHRKMGMEWVKVNDTSCTPLLTEDEAAECMIPAEEFEFTGSFDKCEEDGDLAAA